MLTWRYFQINRATWRVIVRFVLVVFSSMFACAHCESTSNGADDSQAIRDFLLEGIAQRCAKLRTASFTAVGEIKGKTDSTTWKAAEGPIRLRGAFDENRLRFDYGQPSYVVAPEVIAEKIREGTRPGKQRSREEWMTAELDKPSDEKEVVLANVETFFVRTPDKIAYWFNGQPTVFLLAANSVVPLTVVRFDINALGLYGWREFRQGLQTEELVAAYRNKKKFEVTKLGGDLWRLSILYDSGRLTSSRWEFDINPSHGFTVIQSKLKERMKLSGKTVVPQESRVTWEQINGAWVPKTYHIRKANDESGTFTTIDLTFSYNHVNEDLDESLFTYQSFPTPDYVAVIDTSGAKPVIVRHHFENLAQEKTPLSENSNRFRILLIINIAVAGICVLVYFGSHWWKAHSKNRPNPSS